MGKASRNGARCVIVALALTLLAALPSAAGARVKRVPVTAAVSVVRQSGAVSSNVTASVSFASRQKKCLRKIFVSFDITKGGGRLLLFNGAITGDPTGATGFQLLFYADAAFAAPANWSLSYSGPEVSVRGKRVICTGTGQAPGSTVSAPLTGTF